MTLFRFFIKETKTNEYPMDVTANTVKEAENLILENLEALKRLKPGYTFSASFIDNKEVILHSLNEEYFKGVESFPSYDDLYDHIMIRFKDFNAVSKSPKDSFEKLNTEMEGYLSKYFILTTNEFHWEISILDDYNIEDLASLSSALGAKTPSELIRKLNSELDYFICHGILPLDAFSCLTSQIDFDLSKCIHIYCDEVMHFIEPRNMDKNINHPF